MSRVTRRGPRSPDFIVKAMRKDTNEKRKIGAAWHNDDGSISVDIDSFTVIESSPHLVITLFPSDKPDEGDK